MSSQPAKCEQEMLKMLKRLQRYIEGGQVNFNEEVSLVFDGRHVTLSYTENIIAPCYSADTLGERANDPERV